MSSGAAQFALIYLTFFLDNVLLTVLVPILPDLLGDDDSWPLPSNGSGTSNDSGTSNGTAPLPPVTGDTGAGLWAGVVLGAKASLQLVAALWCGARAAGRAARVLRGGTLLLAISAAGLSACPLLPRGGALCAWLVLCRGLQGAGAAGAGVAGLALAARKGGGGLAALLGAVALGVLVGYPLGGAAYQLWSRAAPFQLITGALLSDLALQWIFIDGEECNQGPVFAPPTSGLRGARLAARRGAAGAGAGALLLTTCVLAALEPALPLWLSHKFHPQRWTRGLVFVPDSLGYLLATAPCAAGGGGGAAPEWRAVAGQAAVGGAALLLPAVTRVQWLALPHFVLGAGLGAADAALVPALLARQPRHVAPLAALLQASSSAAYALGPVVGGLVSWWLGFESLVRGLGVANLLYAAYLYRTLTRHPLTEKWGATRPDDYDDECEEDSDTLCLTPLAVGDYIKLRE